MQKLTSSSLYDAQMRINLLMPLDPPITGTPRIRKINQSTSPFR